MPARHPQPAGHAYPLIIRGDLRSRTGLAFHARAQMRLLENDFDIAGVDVHPDPADQQGEFPYPIISDHQLLRRIAESHDRPIVLHHTPVNDFRSFPGAWNVGTFAWETDVPLHLRHWTIKIALMDAMWAQCSMIAKLIQGMGYTGDVHTITWPFDFARVRRSAPGLRQIIPVRLFDDLTMRGFSIRDCSLAEVRQDARNLFVCVQSMAARKGLPILLHEWRRHIVQSDHSDDLLILRLAFRHSSNLTGAPEEHISTMLRNVGFQVGQHARVGVILDPLSDAELSEFFQTADAYVSATLGEGFGGPIVEAIANDRPVIVPRHTAMCDYIAPDYPLIVQSQCRVVGLRGQLSVYPPSASWHVPLPGAVAGKLAAFARIAPSQRAQLARELRAGAAEFCAAPVVRHAMVESFRKLLAYPPAQKVPASCG